MPALWKSIPSGWTHVGFVEIGSSLHRDYDRGALLRHDKQGHLAVWTGRAVRDVDQHKAKAAAASLAGYTEQ